MLKHGLLTIIASLILFSTVAHSVPRIANERLVFGDVSELHRQARNGSPQAQYNLGNL